MTEHDPNLDFGPESSLKSRPEYVIKSVQVGNITEAEECQREVDQLRRLQHRNIVRYIGDFIHVESTLMGSKYFHVLAMEYCSHGDLVCLIEKHIQRNKYVKEKLIMWILEQLCEAVAYIHKLDVIHRDIKLGNILLAADDSVRLADFGLSDKLHNIRRRKVGTLAYMSPEEFWKNSPQ